VDVLSFLPEKRKYQRKTSRLVSDPFKGTAKAWPVLPEPANAGIFSVTKGLSGLL
jgi:hypothetical protein